MDHEVEIIIDINDSFHCDVATTATSQVNVLNNTNININNSPSVSTREPEEVQGNVN